MATAMEAERRNNAMSGQSTSKQTIGATHERTRFSPVGGETFEVDGENDTEGHMRRLQDDDETMVPGLRRLQDDSDDTNPLKPAELRAR
jgi:hypothetical protein